MAKAIYKSDASPLNQLPRDELTIGGVSILQNMKKKKGLERRNKNRMTNITNRCYCQPFGHYNLIKEKFENYVRFGFNSMICVKSNMIEI